MQGRGKTGIERNPGNGGAGHRTTRDEKKQSKTAEANIITNKSKQI